MVDTIELPNALVSLTPLTTGADTVDVQTVPAIYSITTGGTGDVEFINILPPPEVFTGVSDPGYIGKIIVLFLDTQTNPADVVQITTAGSSTPYLFSGAGNPPGNNAFVVTSAGITLDFEGACAAFVWCGSDWFFWPELLNGNVTYTANENQPAIIRGGTSQSTSVYGGTGAAYSPNGGFAQLIGGAAAAPDGNGGYVYIRGGPKVGAGLVGNVIMDTLPTANPAVAGALWNDGGTLKISAG